MKVYELNITGNSTISQWAIYAIIATQKGVSKKHIYIGKVGDNRIGCNPIISRIGNHFSNNKIHSQFRNYLKKYNLPKPHNFNYKIVYTTFGEYSEMKHTINRKRINEIERTFNKSIQENKTKNIQLLNIYKGNSISKKTKIERKKLLTKDDIISIETLVNKVIKG
jgi:hypothetical protein